MDDISKMERFQGTQQVVQYELNMAFCQARLSAHLDDLSEVRLLMFHNEEDMLKTLGIFSLPFWNNDLEKLWDEHGRSVRAYFVSPSN